MLNTVKHTLLALAAALAIYLVPGLAHAATYTLCASLNTSLENVAIGEDYIVDPDGPYAGRYLKVRVTQGITTVVPTTYANVNGCVTFSHGSTGPFLLEIWSEMRVPRTDNTAQNNFGKITNTAGSQAYWSFSHTFTGGSTSKTHFVPSSWATNLLVVTRQSMERFTNGISNKTFLVKDQASGTCPDNSCNDATYDALNDVATIYINPIHNGRKYAIAHELGHALVAHWFERNPWPQNAGDTYDFNGGGTTCEWAGAGEHAMHSMEYAAGALIEGFPHYYAAYAFNSEASVNGSFYYYKDGTGVTLVNVETGPTGGVTAFMDNTCTGSKAGKGCELDWLRQFWDYRTNSGTKPSNGVILTQVESAFGTQSAWHTAVNSPNPGDVDNTVNRMQAAIQAYDQVNGTAFWSRWGAVDDLNGINHPDP